MNCLYTLNSIQRIYLRGFYKKKINLCGQYTKHSTLAKVAPNRKSVWKIQPFFTILFIVAIDLHFLCWGTHDNKRGLLSTLNMHKLLIFFLLPLFSNPNPMLLNMMIHNQIKQYNIIGMGPAGLDSISNRVDLVGLGSFKLDLCFESRLRSRSGSTLLHG